MVLGGRSSGLCGLVHQMDVQNRTAEQVLAALAVDGLVTRKQLLTTGITRLQIQRRLEKGVLIPDYEGVYWVGHREGTPQARYRAAVLACGEGAVLSGKAAAHLWGIHKGSPPQPEVTTTKDRRIKGIKTRRPRSVDPRDITTLRGIPITTVPCTIVDVAATLTEESL